jgi:hypothetical protein
MLCPLFGGLSATAIDQYGSDATGFRFALKTLYFVVLGREQRERARKP